MLRGGLPGYSEFSATTPTSLACTQATVEHLVHPAALRFPLRFPLIANHTWDAR